MLLEPKIKKRKKKKEKRKKKKMLLRFLAGHFTEPILESSCTLKISNLACNPEQYFFIFFKKNFLV